MKIYIFIYLYIIYIYIYMYEDIFGCIYIDKYT